MLALHTQLGEVLVGTSCWSSGEDSVLLMQVARVPSLIGEKDSKCRVAWPRKY